RGPPGAVGLLLHRRPGRRPEGHGPGGRPPARDLTGRRHLHYHRHDAHLRRRAIMSDEQTAGAGEFPATEHEPTSPAETPDADTMRAVAEALEATDGGGDGPVI